MQRVFRFSLVGILGIASLTACGDKVNPNVTTPVDSTIHSVTVTPTSAPMNIGDKLQFVASVQAGSAAKDKTVAWSSSNSTVASVDATGLVTAKAAGVTSIIATANADHSQAAAATVTVGAGAITTVTVSSINQTTGAGSVPANLANVLGQLDVTLNVDAGTAKLNEVDLVMNCTGPGNSGTDTVVAKQTLASSDVAPVAADAASEASAPITLSFNTASFNSTSGAVSFKNGSCSIKGKAITQAGTPPVLTTTTSTSLSLTLNNTDVVIGTMTSGKTAVNTTTGLSWNGVSVTIASTPVFFTPNRSAVSQTIGFAGKTASLTGAGTQSATFTDLNDPALLSSPLNIDNITNANAQATVSVSVVDNSGNSFQNPATAPIATAASYFANPGNSAAWVGPFTATNPFRLDTQKPVAGNFALASNSDQGTAAIGYIGASFKFSADSASGYRGPDAVAGNQTRNLDNGGVDNVTVGFQFATSISGTFATVTNTTGLAETNTSTTNMLRQITTDALGNADTSFVSPAGIPVEFSTVTSNGGVPPVARFGVDITPPVQTPTALSTADLSTSPAANTGNQYQFNILDNLSGTGNVYVAQVRNYNSNSTASAVVTSVIEGTIATNACGTAGLPAVVGTTAPGACITPATAADAAQASTDPCVIGRFNATAAKAGAGNVAVFDRTGAALGFCTPVPYVLGGGVNVPVNAPGHGGYYRTVVIASDQAGNRIATPFSATVLEEGTAPTVANIDMPGSITGNATASFPASVTETSSDNVGDVTASWVSLQYTAVPNLAAGNIVFRFPNTAGPGTAFDNVLTRTATATPTISNFAKSLTQSTGGPVTAAANNADLVTVVAQDAAGSVGTKTVQISAAGTQLVGGATSTFNTATFQAGFRDSTNLVSATNPNTVSNCPAAGCGPAVPVAAVNATTITLFSIAQGTTGTFNNPFNGGAVTFWYRPTASVGPWFFIGTGSFLGTQDTGVPGNGRSWIYTFPSWDPPASAPDGTSLTPPNAGTIQVDIRAVGVNTNGDAIITPGVTITLSNP